MTSCEHSRRRHIDTAAAVAAVETQNILFVDIIRTTGDLIKCFSFVSRSEARQFVCRARRAPSWGNCAGPSPISISPQCRSPGTVRRSSCTTLGTLVVVPLQSSRLSYDKYDGDNIIQRSDNESITTYE